MLVFRGVATPVESPDLLEARRIVISKLSGLNARVFLFGSMALGNTHNASDIDIAIDPGEPLPSNLIAEIADALEESDIIRRVDLVDLSKASAALRLRVEKEGIPWTA
jgi:predicted nucleotidyltransferase